METMGKLSHATVHHACPKRLRSCSAHVLWRSGRRRCARTTSPPPYSLSATAKNGGPSASAAFLQCAKSLEMQRSPISVSPIPSLSSRAQMTRQDKASASRFHSNPSGELQADWELLTRKRLPVHTTRVRSSPGVEARRTQVCPSCELSIRPSGPTTTKIPAP